MGSCPGGDRNQEGTAAKHKTQLAEGRENEAEEEKQGEEGGLCYPRAGKILDASRQQQEAWEEVWGRLFLAFVRQITNYTKQDVLFLKRFGRNHAILIQKSYLMQVYKERGNRKCKCKHGVLSWSSLWLFPLSEVLKISCETSKFFQLEAVLGFHSVCPERERSCELHLNFHCCVLLLFILLVFASKEETQNPKHKTQITGSWINTEKFFVR